ncbi:class I SAM-dependent DNA methyltransferase [Granulicatella seriolae]|uniref:Class I SAM-dependent methyltransferase n=1 Tax=Granulicatella seriolae TaxID=2967226 RepID=A0ABT1WNQ8_9LACT|nr:class I SAM-dependent methyltransferase [Granulicatella seriolae]
MINYQTFAHVYDQVMDQEVYQSWIDFTRTSIEQYAKRPVENIMELACGSGKVAIDLSEQGFTLVGVDLSENMLAIAQEKANRHGQEIAWVQADMRDLRDFDPVDLVTLYSDSLCYLTDFQDVKSVFASVVSILEEGGLFLFDVHSIYQMTQVFPGYQYSYTDEDLAFIWQSYEYDYPNSVEHVITMFLADQEDESESPLYERFEEVHVERSFTIEEYKSALLEAGFTAVKVMADFGKSQLDDHTTRWFFICQK